MTNAEKFGNIFGLYATELWSMPEQDFLKWLNTDVPDTNIGDIISRQDAIEALHDEIVRRRISEDSNDDGTLDEFDTESILRRLPSAQPEDKEACTVCEGLESGDTLYSYSDWDGGIGFDYIWNIKYCPVCGRRLTDE